MKLEKPLELSLSEIVDAVKTVDGVIAIILFGSVARGEADEGSDIDLFVLFDDEDKMRLNEWEVTRRVPSKVFAQTICACPSTLGKLNPVFLRSVLEDGLILYARYPLVLNARLANATAFFIVTYVLRNLPQKEKQKVNYRLFGSKVSGRRYSGLVEQYGGRHLGRGCFLIPKEKTEDVLNVLKEYGIKYNTIETYIPSQPLKSEAEAILSNAQAFVKAIKKHLDSDRAKAASAKLDKVRMRARPVSTGESVSWIREDREK